MGSSFLALNMQFGGFFNIFGRFFRIKVKIIKYRSVSPFQSPIAAKPLEDSGEAAIINYSCFPHILFKMGSSKFYYWDPLIGTL